MIKMLMWGIFFHTKYIFCSYWNNWLFVNTEAVKCSVDIAYATAYTTTIHVASLMALFSSAGFYNYFSLVLKLNMKLKEIEWWWQWI